MDQREGELHGGKPGTLEEQNRQIEDAFVAVPGNALENVLGLRLPGCNLMGDIPLCL
jgi:hypothetical protein